MALSNKLLLPVEVAAGKVAVDSSVLFGLIEEKTLTAFVALPVVLVYPHPELRSLEAPLSLLRTSGVFALHPTEAAAIAAGYRTEVKILFDYGDYLPEREYRNKQSVVLADPIFPDSTKLRVNLTEVQQALSFPEPEKTEKGLPPDPQIPSRTKGSLWELIAAMCLSFYGDIPSVDELQREIQAKCSKDFDPDFLKQTLEKAAERLPKIQ